MMIRMFDRDGNGTINFDEFVSLWKYLAAWRELFDRFDEDRSGRISLQEFENALVAFGYRLTTKFVGVLFTAFESKTRQVNGPPARSPGQNGMSFDLFVQACISLKRMTDVFKRYDEDRDGYITVSFEEFLTGKFVSVQQSLLIVLGYFRRQMLTELLRQKSSCYRINPFIRCDDLAFACSCPWLLCIFRLGLFSMAICHFLVLELLTFAPYTHTPFSSSCAS